MSNEDYTPAFGMPLVAEFRRKQKRMIGGVLVAMALTAIVGLGVIGAVAYIIVDQVEKGRAHDVEMQRIGAERTAPDVLPSK